MADDARRSGRSGRGRWLAPWPGGRRRGGGTVGRVADLDLEDIYARHRQGLFTLALSITRCAARAEDAVHDAFVRLCRRRSVAAPLEGTGAASQPDAVAYVFASVRNAAV